MTDNDTTEHNITEQDGRSAIIRNALELLNEVHPEDLSIREVARRAGLSSGAPYHHFKTKTDLLAACAVVAWTDLCEQLESGGGDTPRQQILEQTASYLRFARTNPGPYQLMTSRLLDNDHRFGQIVALRARAIGGGLTIIQSGVEPPIDQATAKLRGVALWSMLHGHITLDDGTPTQGTRLSKMDEAMSQLATRMALLPEER